MKARRFLLLLAAVIVVFTPAAEGVRKWDYQVKHAPVKRWVPKSKTRTYMQLDPLRVVKNFNDPNVKVGPNIVIAMDTSMRMAFDFEGNFYDEQVWDKSQNWDTQNDTDPRAVAASLGVPGAVDKYRRKWTTMVRQTNAVGSNIEYQAERLDAVDSTEADFPTFYDITRLGMARDGLAQVVTENAYIVNFGIQEMRQGNNTVLPTNADLQEPVTLTGAQSAIIGDIIGAPQWRTSWVLPTTRNVDQGYSDSNQRVRVIENSSASSDTLYMLQQPPDSSDQSKTLLPGGRDVDGFVDAPVKRLVDDSLTYVKRAMDKDADKFRPCRNMAVIMVLGGMDGASLDPAASAAAFTSVTVKGVTKRVPIYVIAIGPLPADVPQLRAIADNSGGEYFEAYDANQVAWAGNYVVQSVFRRAAEFDANTDSEWQTVSPVVGTVDLTNGKDIDGNPLLNSNATSGGALIPQQANVLLTGGFSLPGMYGQLHAFRAYKPVADATKPMGYTFVKDGTRLWKGHVPPDAQRNLYTYIPGTGMIPFDQAHLASIQPYLRVADADVAHDLIDYVRGQPLGAIVDSTPGVMNPPSLDPPDAAYSTFANAHKNRRTQVFVGANDGMLHAIDGRLGVETWAFIPYNLLPKLQTLLDGQPVDSFDYFVDSSPKLSDVFANGAWRTYLFIGQGPGGTFYHTFDVTEAANNVDPTLDSEASVLSAFSSASVIPLQWTFPDYAAFDYTLSFDDMPYGDIAAAASPMAKTVGQTWSDPAIGQITDGTSPWVMLVGSGYLPATVQSQANRANRLCGTTFYALDVGTGSVLASYDVGDDPNKNTLKAALQADPTASGPTGTRYIDTVYIGDTEGMLWRFKLSHAGASVSLSAPVKLFDGGASSPIYTSLALVNVGGNNTYVFLTTGIDILPWTTTDKLKEFALIGLLDTGGNGLAAPKFERKLNKTNGAGGDERPTAAPAVAGDVVFFTTTTEYPDTPCRIAESSLFATTYIGGPAYDLNADNKINNLDTVMQKPIGRATSVFVADEHLYFGSEQGVEIFGDPEDYNSGALQLGLRMLTWREGR